MNTITISLIAIHVIGVLILLYKGYSRLNKRARLCELLWLSIHDYQDAWVVSIFWPVFFIITAVETAIKLTAKLTHKLMLKITGGEQ